MTEGGGASAHILLFGFLLLFEIHEDTRASFIVRSLSLLDRHVLFVVTTATGCVTPTSLAPGLGRIQV